MRRPLVGIAVTDGLVSDLDASLDDLLDAAGTPAGGLSWRHLLSMQRGADTTGAWETDEVMAQPAGWLDRWRSAPRLEPAGRTFRYDDGAAYLLGAALHRITGDLGNYATRRLFQPLGIHAELWLQGPEGFVHGAAHLRLSARDLARIGLLWIDGGRCGSATLVDAEFLEQMFSPSSQGGPPENTAYGFLIWLADGYWFAGGWAGQHVVCIPATRAVIVVTGHPDFRPGPPPTDAMPPDWRPAIDLVRDHLLPLLLP